MEFHRRELMYKICLLERKSPNVISSIDINNSSIEELEREYKRLTHILEAEVKHNEYLEYYRQGQLLASMAGTALGAAIKECFNNKDNTISLNFERLQQSECSICFEKYENDSNIKITQCGHIFHSKCLDNYISSGNRVCPLCRGKIN